MKERFYITVTRGVKGWFAVCIVETLDRYGHVVSAEPEQSSYFGYDDRCAAEFDARRWAEAEDLELRLRDSECPEPSSQG